MKKRVLEIFLLSLLAILLVYGQGTLGTVEKKPEEIKTLETEKVVNSLPYTKVKDNFYSQLIGATKSDLLKVLGTPKESSQENQVYELLDFGSNDGTFLQVRLKNQYVAEILSFGVKEKNAPFKIGMKESDLSQLTTLNSNYDLSHLGEELSFELAEEDINYRPLVAFENDSFGIFYFDPMTNGLLAISYLSKERLEEKMPYQLVTGEKKATPFSEDPQKMQEENQLFTENYRKVMNHLRQKQKLVTLGNLYDNDEATKKALTQFSQQPDKWLEKDTYQDLQEAKERGTRVIVGGKELDAIGKNLHLPKISDGLLKMQVEDSFAEALEDFMFPPINRTFHQETSDIFSVATVNQNMLVLLTETKVTQKTTDSSGEGE